MTSIEHLRAFAKPLGVRILLENIPNELSIPDKLVEFIQITHFDDIGVCFDFGHAHIMSNVAEAFEILKGHIHSTHVHDNAGDRDSHLWPGGGTIVGDVNADVNVGLRQECHFGMTHFIFLAARHNKPKRHERSLS